MGGFFYNLGRQLGRKAVPAIRKSKWIYDGLAGSEEEALRAEHSMGKELAKELRETLSPARDAALGELVSNITNRLAAGVKDKRRVFQTEMFHDPVPNAMALPGGFIFLSNSLAEFCLRDADELSFAIGHEMAHVIRRHSWDRMVNDAALKVASTVSARMGPLGGWVRREGIGMLRTAHSKKCEFEADEFGLRLAAAADYPVEGTLAFLQRLGRNQGRVPAGEYFSSHPAPAERIGKLQQYFPAG